jgi:predicted MPP superfamily phosphohydrolase
MWVAMLIIFFATAVALDIYNIVLKHIVSLFYINYRDFTVSPSNILLVSFSVSTLCTLFGLFDARRLRVENLTIETSKLPEGVNRIRIFQISDLHLGIILGRGILNKVISEIDKAKPDLIVSTGDLLDAEMNHIDYLAEYLRRLNPRLGKFAVLGNHESYSGIDHAVEFIENAGFTVLRGEGTTVKDEINIAGVDDPAIKIMEDNGSADSETDMLSQLPSDKFTLLLKHRPTINKGSLGLFDLQLSGHTHKGQIFPVHLAIMIFFPYYAGFYEFAKGSVLYTSRGTGTAGPPVRFLAPPEVTVIDIVSGSKRDRDGS